MQPAGLEQVKAIFAVAMEKTAAERQDFLDGACGADSALRTEVAAFVHAAEKAGDFLSLPARDPVTAAAGIAAGPLSEGPGTAIGRYKLLEHIGEGGFGSVFMAEQESPVRRKVALKIIKLGMDTRQVVARFEAERQALAMMEHPNIAKVLDGGSTETGRPYFVMELVKGVPITSYCNDNKLTTMERLDLFMVVCGAVQHAHQKGIIHRDLKPSNVLVTMRDAKAVPMVIDFGIAKATQSRLTEKTLFTEFKQMIGTPTYMSPEQAQLNTQDVDTRSDIYSLGVLLYELLTGTTPFQARELLSLAYGEMQRVIREVEPPKPSTRLSSLGDTASTAADGQRPADARRLSKIVKGDLDWIVMKCLEKDRTRRYETANGLSKDIQRYLADEPVEASPPSSTYRARRFIRRYRRGLGIAAVVAVLLTATTAFSVWEAVFARRAKANALAAAQAAKIEAAKSRQVANFLEDILGGQNPVIAHGRDTTILREILERTLTRMDQELADQPEVRAELYSTIARTYHLAELPGSAEMQRKALELQRSVFKGDNLAVALSEYRLASMLQPHPNALPLAEESLGMRQRISGDAPATADSLTLVGTISRRLNQLPKAEAMLRQGIEMRKRLADQNSVQYAMNLDELGVALWLQGKRAEGLALTRQAVDLERKVLPDALPYVLQHLAFELHAGGDLLEAQTTAAELLAIQTRNFPETAWSRMDCNRLLASVDNDLGDYANAERLGRQNLKLDPDDTRSMFVLAQVLFNEQKYSEAEPLFRDALGRNRRALPTDDLAIASNLTSLANLLSAQGKYDEAEPVLSEGLELFRKLSQADPYDVAWSMTCLANSLSDQGKYSEANPYFRDAVQLFRAYTAAGNPTREWSTTCFANSLLYEGDYVQSEPLFREALAAQGEKLQEHTTQTRVTALGLANLLARTGRAAEAAALRTEFGLSDPATQPATRSSLSAAPTPSPNDFN